jgi:hypothetical protein
MILKQIIQGNRIYENCILKAHNNFKPLLIAFKAWTHLYIGMRNETGKI